VIGGHCKFELRITPSKTIKISLQGQRAICLALENDVDFDNLGDRISAVSAHEYTRGQHHISHLLCLNVRKVNADVIGR